MGWKGLGVMTELRPRLICSYCQGAGIITRDNPQPGRWFTKMGLVYQEGVWFSHSSGETRDTISYDGHLVDDSRSDLSDVCDDRNERLKADLAPAVACSHCYGVGTVPKPLESEELGWDRMELEAEAFMDGGMQGYNDFQDEWSEYVGQRGSHADPVQRAIEQAWAKAHPDPRLQEELEYSY